MPERIELVIELEAPYSDEIARTIEFIPAVQEVMRPPAGARIVTALLEEGADVDETAYLIESLPGIRSVSD